MRILQAHEKLFQESPFRMLERQGWEQMCALWGKGSCRWVSWSTLHKTNYLVLSFGASDHKREN